MATMYNTYALIFIFLLSIAIDNVSSKTNGERLADLVNNYRAQKGLSRIPYSKALMKVAKLHAVNTCQVQGIAWKDRDCWNPHSWDRIPGTQQDYETCCFSTFDSSTFDCIWDKPREIANFDTNGFEITTGGATLSDALSGWKSSSDHNDLIIQANSWRYYKWKAIGCAFVANRVAHCWFASTADNSYYRSQGEPYCAAKLEVDTEEGAESEANTVKNAPNVMTGWWIAGGLLVAVMICVIAFCLYKRKKRRETQGFKIHDEDEEVQEDGVVIEYVEEDEVEMNDGDATTKEIE